MALLPDANGAREGAVALSVAALRAKAALVRKRTKTPLEDALAADGGTRAVRLVQWARKQKAQYDAGLVQWRANRLKWAQEAQDIFDHRARARRERDEAADAASVFDVANESVNIVAALAEFAAAQAEQDIFGGEPWFAATPVGRTDVKLADDIQHHLQWTFRDGRFVDAQCQGIDHAVTLGECFMKMMYSVEVDEHEAMTPCLHMDGEPVLDDAGRHVTCDAQAAGMRGRLTGRMEWRDAYERRQTVIRLRAGTLDETFLNESRSLWQQGVAGISHWNDFLEHGRAIQGLHVIIQSCERAGIIQYHAWRDLRKSALSAFCGSDYSNKSWRKAALLANWPEAAKSTS